MKPQDPEISGFYADIMHMIILEETCRYNMPVRTGEVYSLLHKGGTYSNGCMRDAHRIYENL